MKIRSLLAVALLAPTMAFAAPVKPAAKSTSAAASSGSANVFDGLQLGGFVGYEADEVSGISLRVDGEVPFRALSPQVNLSWVGSFGYSRLAKDPVTVNLVKIVPAARFSFPLSREVSLFADGGLGFYYASMKVEFPAFGVPGTLFYEPAFTAKDSEFSLMMRIGGGAFYQLNEKTKIGAMIEFDPLFGDADLSTFLIQGGVMFRM